MKEKEKIQEFKLSDDPTNENVIKIGDVLVCSSKSSLKECKKIALALIDDKIVERYLSFSNIKRYFAGIG